MRLKAQCPEPGATRTAVPGMSQRTQFAPLEDACNAQPQEGKAGTHGAGRDLRDRPCVTTGTVPDGKGLALVLCQRKASPGQRPGLKLVFVQPGAGFPVSSDFAHPPPTPRCVLGPLRLLGCPEGFRMEPSNKKRNLQRNPPPWSSPSCLPSACSRGRGVLQGFRLGGTRSPHLYGAESRPQSLCGFTFPFPPRRGP